jgi:hypothetical protein
VQNSFILKCSSSAARRRCPEVSILFVSWRFEVNACAPKASHSAFGAGKGDVNDSRPTNASLRSMRNRNSSNWCRGGPNGLTTRGGVGRECIHRLRN